MLVENPDLNREIPKGAVGPEVSPIGAEAGRAGLEREIPKKNIVIDVDTSGKFGSWPQIYKEIFEKTMGGVIIVTNGIEDIRALIAKHPSAIAGIILPGKDLAHIGGRPLISLLREHDIKFKIVTGNTKKYTDKLVEIDLIKAEEVIDKGSGKVAFNQLKEAFVIES